MIERWLARVHPRLQSLRRITSETGLARATVRKYAFSDTFPRHGLRGPFPSILDHYLDHLHTRLTEGCENAMQLWREVRGLGFLGTPKQVRRWLSERRSRPAKTTARKGKTACRSRSGLRAPSTVHKAAVVASGA
jgi:hypothetical protein